MELMTRADRRMAKFIIIGLILILSVAELCIILSGVDGGYSLEQRIAMFLLGLILLVIVIGIRID